MNNLVACNDFCDPSLFMIGRRITHNSGVGCLQFSWFRSISYKMHC